jgi:integrase
MTKTTEATITHAALQRRVEKAQKEGREDRINCGDGLILVVTKAGRARFLHRFPYKGRYPTRWFDGQFPDDLSLRDAQDIRDRDLEVLANNLNPADDVSRQTVENPTLAEFVTTHFRALCPPAQLKWADEPERSAWFRQITQHVGVLAQTRIDAIKMNDVVAAVKPYWDGARAKPEGRKMVFAIQRALKHRALILRPSEPYHKWLTLEAVQAQPGLGKKKHIHRKHPSLRYDQAPGFVAQLRLRDTMSARLTEWIILTGVRANEGIGARWREIDWDLMAWVIPPERLKMEQGKGEEGECFVVPISASMLRVLNSARKGLPCRPDDFIFPSFHHGKVWADKPYAKSAPLNEVNLIAPEITVHGFRRTLVGWGIGESHRKREPFTLELMDRVLGHMIGRTEDEEDRVSKALASYVGRGYADPFIERRRVVLREWSFYLNGRPPFTPPPAGQMPVPEVQERGSHLRLAA